MTHEIDQADLGVWRNNLIDCLEELDLLPFDEYVYGGTLMSKETREKLRGTIIAVYDGIGVAVENSLVQQAKSEQAHKAPERNPVPS
jgi:hypothetical protein